MHIPEYKDGSIVNLMSSVVGALGGKTGYRALAGLPPSEISSSKNIILIIIDGMGHEFIKKHGKGSFLWKNTRSKMTSVFPSTTAAAITTFRTGLPPSRHAVTGWFMHYKQLGGVGVPLRFRFRAGGRFNIEPKKLIPEKPVFDKIKCRSFMILPKELSTTEYTRALSGRAAVRKYSTLNGLFRQAKKAVRLPGRKLVYAYWPELDHFCHEFGTSDRRSISHFREIDESIKNFVSSLEGAGSIVIVTADHGLMDSPVRHQIRLESHPRLQETLALPLCGESRAVYCYVRPSKARQFETYVRKHFREVCHMYKSSVLVKKGWFGPGKPDPRLLDRVGDYVLVMKKDYSISDTLVGERKSTYIGRHGGVSKEEMDVPLILIKA